MSIEIDLTRGVYRRVYAGFLTGRRINSVSIQAEAWFWRLHALADDYGNLMADPTYLRTHAAPRRDVGAQDAKAWTDELAAAGLLRRYTIGDDEYASIIDFEKNQPAGRNGRRIRRVPGESGGIQGDPGEPCKSVSANTHPHTHSDTDTDSERRGEPKGTTMNGDGRRSNRFTLMELGVAGEALHTLENDPRVTPAVIAGCKLYLQRGTKRNRGAAAAAYIRNTIGESP